MLGLLLGKAATINALNNRPPTRVIIKRFTADYIPPVITPALPVPSELGPPSPDMVRKDEPLEFAAAEIFKMNFLN
ncbi:hypothetical protein ACWGTO_22580 [Mesorhizobium sp. PL10]